MGRGRAVPASPAAMSKMNQSVRRSICVLGDRKVDRASPSRSSRLNSFEAVETERVRLVSEAKLPSEVTLPASTILLAGEVRYPPSENRYGKSVQHAMSLSSGTRLAHFEIVAPTGAGGIEVYRERSCRMPNAWRVSSAKHRYSQYGRRRIRNEKRLIES